VGEKRIRERNKESASNEGSRPSIDVLRGVLQGHIASPNDFKGDCLESQNKRKADVSCGVIVVILYSLTVSRGGAAQAKG
jgi:hypothetical protein